MARRTRKPKTRFPRPSNMPVHAVEPGNYVGVDEVGVGAWAGPLVAAAVAIPHGVVEGVRDSKKIAEDLRYSLADEIRRVAKIYKIVVIRPEFIDKNGLDAAWDKAVGTAIVEVQKECDWPVVLDGNKLPTSGVNLTAFPKADDSVYQVGAASIVAKAHRDTMMVSASAQYPNYGFERHKGYGTKAHMEALKKYGACAIHRKSFRPVSNPDKPLPKEELEFSEAKAKSFLDSIGDINHNRFASDWEKEFVGQISSLVQNGKRLSPRQMFFLQAIARRRRRT